MSQLKKTETYSYNNNLCNERSRIMSASRNTGSSNSTSFPSRNVHTISFGKERLSASFSRKNCTASAQAFHLITETQNVCTKNSMKLSAATDAISWNSQAYSPGKPGRVIQSLSAVAGIAGEKWEKRKNSFRAHGGPFRLVDSALTVAYEPWFWTFMFCTNTVTAITVPGICDRKVPRKRVIEKELLNYVRKLCNYGIMVRWPPATTRRRHCESVRRSRDFVARATVAYLTTFWTRASGDATVHVRSESPTTC